MTGLALSQMIFFLQAGVAWGVWGSGFRVQGFRV